MSRRSGTERIILGHKAWRLAARLLRERCQRLWAEVSRLDALWGKTVSQRDHWQREAQRRIYVRQELADLLGTEDIERAVDAVWRLRSSIDSANARCNRIQADGNALADQLHAWRQACVDHGIEATPEALRAALRRVDAACVVGADL